MRIPTLLALCLMLAPAPRAAEAKLESLDAPAEAVPAALRAVLGTGLRASVDGKLVAELWPVKEAALRPQENLILGAHYGRLVEGSLLGIVRLPETWTDYHGKPVPAGTYTLRYAIQPGDGKHRDSLLLSPVSADTDPKPLPARDDRPAVMGLVPVPQDAKIPSILERKGATLSIAVQAGNLAFGVVVRGQP